MRRTVWNGNCITGNMYPNRFESVDLISNGKNMGHPQLLTPIYEYITYVVVIIFVSSLFDVWGDMWLYDFTCLPKPRGRSTLLVATHSVGGGGGGKIGSWRKW